MALKTSVKDRPERVSRTYKTKDSPFARAKGFRWWEEKEPKKRNEELLATVAYLKEGQAFRARQAARYARLYGGQSLFSFVGENMTKMDQMATLAPNRPTFNLISSVIDTLVSRLTSSNPRPVFLCDNSNYKERSLSKKLNSFILGLFYEAQAYEKGEYVLTDALDQGTGCIKIIETEDHRVGLERRLLTELFVDLQESAFGNPRRLYEVQLMDREVLESLFPDEKEKVAAAVNSTIDNSAETSKSVADLVMVVEGWSLPSGENTDDGYHSIACSSGELFGEKWNKKKFPFVFLHHHKRQLGFWSQGVAETLMGTQLELNSLLDTISKAIKLVGVPRVFYEEGSKVNKASFSNKIGVLIPYRGVKPTYEVAPCVPQEMYAERDRIIQYGYRQEGLSELSAAGQKPAGLNSGEAQRIYNDTNDQRFAALEKRYTNFYIDLAYAMMDKAVDIAEKEGKYKTVYRDQRKGTQEIDLPNIKKLKNPFVIQAYSESSLPKDPAGRAATITEWIQSNYVSIEEGMRLLDLPMDMEQTRTLKEAPKERIFYYLDAIVEDGEWNPPDEWMSIPDAKTIVTQYINLYATCKLEETKMQQLRDFWTQLLDLQAKATPPMPVPNNGLAAPVPVPQSQLLPQGRPAPAPMQQAA
jgi:hypothetical protein